MAIFHFSIKIFSRGKGHSAVEKAAYRSAEELRSEYNGKTYDYTRKAGVVHTEILLPNYAPSKYADRAALWNSVEESERNGNAQFAREIEFSLPVELSVGENIALTRNFVQRHFTDKGMCADICVHDKGDGNPHAHVMLTMRPINPDGHWGAKARKEYILDKNGERIRLPSGEYKSRNVPAVDWNAHTKAEQWRSEWADAVNAALQSRGIEARIDHRSYKRQGVDTLPSVHMGVAAMQMERKGVATERGDINRSVGITNSRLCQQRARIKKAKDWLYAIPIQNAPTMLDMMTHIADWHNLPRSKQLKNLQLRAKIFIFMEQNGVYDVEQLADKVEQMSRRHYETANAIREKDRRLGTLNRHLEQHETLKQTRPVYKKYMSLDPKKRGKYAEKHAGEIRLHREATEYFKGVMNGRTELPVKKWWAEWEKLTAEKYALCDEYYQLDDDLKNVEALRRGAENIMREELQREQPIRTRGMER
jgi:hypothetical protein